VIRRVVTGHDETGKAVVLFDGAAPNVRERPQTGIVSTLLWTTDAAPARYANGDRGNATIGTAPPPSGSILRLVEFPPYAGGADNAAMLASMGLHGDTSGRRPARHEFMHATDSVDYAIVLDGEIDMLLDEDEVHLKAGDVLVQQGTNHAWVNRSDRPCRVAFVLLDAAGAPLVPIE
jgi:hypothetical protein